MVFVSLNRNAYWCFVLLGISILSYNTSTKGEEPSKVSLWQVMRVLERLGMSEYVIAVLTLTQKRCWHSRSCPLQVANDNTAIQATSRQENHLEKNNWLLFPVWVRLNLVSRQDSLSVHLDTWQLIPHDNNKVWSSESGASPGFCCRIRFICQAMFYAGSTHLKTLGGHGRRSHYLPYISRMTITCIGID